MLSSDIDEISAVYNFWDKKNLLIFGFDNGLFHTPEVTATSITLIMALLWSTIDISGPVKWSGAPLPEQQ